MSVVATAKVAVLTVATAPIVVTAKTARVAALTANKEL